MMPPSQAARPAAGRVLMVLDSLHVGGTEMFATRAAELLTSAGHEVHVALLRTEGALLDRMRAAASVHGLDVPPGRFRVFRLARALRGCIRRLRPTVVYSHDIFSNYISAAALLGLASIRFVSSWRWTTVDTALRLKLAAAAARRSDVVVTNAEALRDSLAQLGVDPARVHWVPNLLEDEAFAIATASERELWREALGIPAGRLVVMCAGRLQHLKGQDVALAAWELLHEEVRAHLQLVFAGEGELRAALASRVEAAGLGRSVSFAGGYRTPPNIFRYADLVLLPSRSEGMPNTLLEAAAVGVPGVATRVGGVEQFAVAAGGAYLTCDASDPLALAAQLERAAADVEWRTQAAASAISYVRRHHRAPAVLAALERDLLEP